MTKSEVSRVHSTLRLPFQRNFKLKEPVGKEQIRGKKLNPNYVAGFVDGEGSFCVGISKHKTLRRGIEINPLFDQHRLQAKKAQSYRIFRKVVMMMRRKEHLTNKGFAKIVTLRNQMRKIGRNQDRFISVKTARVRENRSPGGVRQKN